MARREFNYQPPSYSDVAARAERKGSMFASMFKDVKVWTPKQGANLIRILPPTWENNKGHYGLYVKLHYNVGPNDDRYLCLKDRHSPHKRCPVCEALYDLGANASRDEKFALRPADGVAYYIIDRDNERDGVQTWLSSPTNDSEIAAQSVNRRNQSVIPIADLYDGYDVEFTRTGTGVRGTKYKGFKVMRDSSPLSDSDRKLEEWLDYVIDRPLPTTLNFYSPEHIEEAFYGHARDSRVESSRLRSDRLRNGQDDESAEDEERPRLQRYRARNDGEDDDRPSSARRSTDQDDEEERPSALRSERSSRERVTDNDDSEKPSSRSRRNEEDEERPARSVRRRSESNEDESSVQIERRPNRSRLSQELDDEIPSEAGRPGKPNGRDDEVAEEQQEARPTREDREQRVSRSRRNDDDDERAARRPTRSERATRRDDDDENDDERPRRDADEHESRRSAMRESLRR
jgi:hypothetical protein